MDYNFRSFDFDIFSKEGNSANKKFAWKNGNKA